MKAANSPLVTSARAELKSLEDRRGGAGLRCRTRTRALVADPTASPPGNDQPLPRARIAVPRPRRVRAIGGPQRVLRERVLDVGEDQLLMLLLVIEPQLDHGATAASAASIGRLEERQRSAASTAAR